MHCVWPIVMSHTPTHTHTHTHSTQTQRLPPLTPPPPSSSSPLQSFIRFVTVSNLTSLNSPPPQGTQHKFSTVTLFQGELPAREGGKKRKERGKNCTTGCHPNIQETPFWVEGRKGVWGGGGHVEKTWQQNRGVQSGQIVGTAAADPEWETRNGDIMGWRETPRQRHRESRGSKMEEEKMDTGSCTELRNANRNRKRLENEKMFFLYFIQQRQPMLRGCGCACGGASSIYVF